MKNTYMLSVLLVASLGSLAFLRSHEKGFERNFHQQLNASGAPAGKTGAPGESNCTECHSGSVQSGTDIDTIFVSLAGTPVTSFVPGQTYDVRVAMGNFAAKNGFELTALTSSSNSASGTLTAVTANGNKKITGGGKQYITHTSAGNVQNSWAFSWTAPATGSEGVTFYLATNKTNSSNTNSGDLIRTSNLTLSNSLGLSENSVKMNSEAWYAASNNSVVASVSGISSGKVHIAVVQENGKIIVSEDAGSVYGGENQYEVVLPSTITSGIYLVTISVDNNRVTKRIPITR